MREILFRGKRKDNGEWIEGYYCNCVKAVGMETITSIQQTNDNSLYFREVIPETVGQFTGLTDKNGKKIFEGDILRLCNGTYPILVYWDCLGWKFLRNGKRVQGAFECDIKHDIELCEVIGNIHDKPELLQEK